MQRAGFTLLELSIVLVTVGLLSGGVVAGKELIRQSELRSIVTDVNEFSTALNSFRTKYNAIPGDMRNATDYWGSRVTQCGGGACPKPYTRNGNGNGVLVENEGDSSSPEYWEAWRQLDNAGFLKGNFTGMSAAATSEMAAPGQNVPASKVSGVGYTMHSRNVRSLNDGSMFSGNYNMMMSVGTIRTGITNMFAFTPLEVQSIDKKIDDGYPGLGMLRVYRHVEMCHGTQDQNTPYSNSAVGNNCAMIFSVSGDPGNYGGVVIPNSGGP